MPVELSAIILNYRDPALTERCVRALSSATAAAGLATEVIVVDNSAPETAAALRERLPASVILIENDENQGFSRANNQGIRRSSGRFLLLLNNDAFVSAEALRSGLDYLEQRPDTGLWAPQLVGEDGFPQVSCARLPTLTSLAGEYLLGRYRDWYVDAHRWDAPRPVESVVGAFMLMPRRTIETVGLLDEVFFFNIEDVDFCKRIRETGLEIVYDPRSRVTHIGGASQQSKWVSDPYIHRMRVLYFRKHYGRIAAALAWLFIQKGLLLRRMKRFLTTDRHRYSRINNTD